MLSFKRLIAVIAVLAVLPLAGCGFKPMYTVQKGGDSLSRDFGNIEISNIPDREGQVLRNLLIDRLYTRGRQASTRYVLDMTPVKIKSKNLGIRKTATATFTQIYVSTNLTLTDRFTGEKVLERELTTVNSYNILNSQYATIVSERAAQEQALKEIAENAVTQIALYFNRIDGNAQ